MTPACCPGDKHKIGPALLKRSPAAQAALKQFSAYVLKLHLFVAGRFKSRFLRLFFLEELLFRIEKRIGGGRQLFQETKYY